MKYHVIFRNDSIPDMLRDYAQERVQHVEKYGEKFEKSEIILDVQHGETLCEIILHPHRGSSLIAHNKAQDGRSAIDGAVVKLERQFLKNKEKKSAARRKG